MAKIEILGGNEQKKQIMMKIINSKILNLQFLKNFGQKLRNFGNAIFRLSF